MLRVQVSRWAGVIVGLIGLVEVTRAEGLWEAAAMGDVAAMERELAKGASLTAPNERGWTPIQVAAAYGSREAVIWLLNHKVDVNSRIGGDSPLSLACANGHIDLAMDLLQRGARYHRRDDGLRQAALAGQTECVRLLLEQGVQLAPVTVRELIESVLKAGHVEPVILLRRAQRQWQKLGNVALQEREDELLRAAYAGDVGRVRASLGPADGSGDFAMRAAMTLARQQGHMEVIEALRIPAARALAEAEHRRKLAAGGNKFMWGAVEAYFGDLIDVRARLEAGADVESPWLEDAVKQGKLDLVGLILDHGADINERYTAEKQTALYQAAAKGQTQMVRLLLERGADADVPDVDGVTPLQLAQRNRHAEVVDLLRKHRLADPAK